MGAVEDGAAEPVGSSRARMARGRVRGRGKSTAREDVP